MLRLALTATGLALTAAQRCAEAFATACELGLVACCAARIRIERAPRE